MNIETRAQYRELLASLENGELIAEATYDAMVDFAKSKKMKRPARPEQFFVEAKKAKAQPKADRPMNRKQCNARLEELGYDGPTSYLMPVLRNIVLWAEAGYNMLDTDVPAAAHAAANKTEHAEA